MSEDIFIVKNYLKGMEFSIKHQMYFEINYEQTKEFYNSIHKLLKEIVDLKTKLEIEKIDNKYNQEERDEETIPRYKIREKIKKYDKWILEGGDYTESLEAQRYALNELLEENTNE